MCKNIKLETESSTNYGCSTPQSWAHIGIHLLFFSETLSIYNPVKSISCKRIENSLSLIWRGGGGVTITVNYQSPMNTFPRQDASHCRQCMGANPTWGSLMVPFLGIMHEQYFPVEKCSLHWSKGWKKHNWDNMNILTHWHNLPASYSQAPTCCEQLPHSNKKYITVQLICTFILLQ
jgi:hypothetical protein